MTLELNSIIKKLPNFTLKERQLEKKLPVFVLAFFLSSLVLISFYRTVVRIAAVIACPLPTTVSTQVTLTPGSPGSTDNIIDCSALDITVTSTGEIVVDNYVTDDSSLNGDSGVVLQVKSLTVEAGGKVTANGSGYTAGDNEAGTGNPQNAVGTTGGSGGGHGGAGGEGVQDPTNAPPTPGIVYGNREIALTLGAGGSASGEGGAGGNGGGAIKIESTGIVTVNGEITANGEDGVAAAASSGGGGAGGSIWIEAGQLAGNGTISANGGSAADVGNQGGGGGGGRVMVFCDTQNNFTGTVTVAGGLTSNSQNGGAGSELGATCRPDEPTILKQFEEYTQSGTQYKQIAIGGATKRTKVIFVSNMEDVDASDTLTLQIEVKQLGTAFTNIPNYTQSPEETNPQLCNDTMFADCGNIRVLDLIRSAEYHWQARVRDDKGGFSSWVSYGGNNEADRDLLLSGDPSSIAIVSGNNQSAVVGNQLPNPLVARVEDQNGFGVPDVTVIEWLPAQGSVQNKEIITNNSGEVSAERIMGTVSGNQTTEVKYNSLTNTFTHNATPDVLVGFDVSAPSFALKNTDFTTDIRAIDQYGNTVITHTGLVDITPVDPNEYTTTLTNNLTPISAEFTLSNNGIVHVQNTQYDVAELIVIKVNDQTTTTIEGFSNDINILDAFGDCFGFANVPSTILLTAVDSPWVANAIDYPGGIIQCDKVDMIVETGAIVQLNPYESGDTNYNDDYGITWVTKSLDIEASSSVTADGVGYPSVKAGTGRGPGGGLPSCSGGGASFGGYGMLSDNGTSALPYGNVYEPNELGSGGGGDNCGNTYATGPGTSGGGSIKLVTTNILNNDGLISANGTNGSNGGGSGGSIWIDTKILNGSSTGYITTNGGNATKDGAGGRIAIYYDTIGTFPIDVAHIQSRGISGGPGTVYVEHVGVDPQLWYKTLYVDNNDSNGRQAGLPEAEYLFDEINLKNKGHLDVMGAASILHVPNVASISGDDSIPDLTIEGTFDYTGGQPLIVNQFDLRMKGKFEGVSSLTVGNLSTGNVALYANTWFYNDTQSYQFNNVNVGSNGFIQMISHENGNTDYTDDYGVTIDANNITIDNNGEISAYGTGYPSAKAAYGKGPGGGAPSCDGGGGSYGGSGRESGYGVITNPYGNVYEPDDLGSGGGGDNCGNTYATGPGTSGAGAIRLNVNNTFTNNGTLSANGANGSNGAGSGGSIWINTSSLNGSPTGYILANGGDASRDGSGGRIAIYYNSISDFSIDVEHVQSRGGGPGTVYVEQKGVDPVHGAKLYIDNANLNGEEAGLVSIDDNPETVYEFDEIHLTRYGHLKVHGEGTFDETNGVTSTGNILRFSNANALIGDSTIPKLSVWGTLDYTGSSKLFVNSIDLGINGDITGVTDFTVGNISETRMRLYAKTWAKSGFYTFGDIEVSDLGTLVLISYDSGDTDYTNDYGFNLSATNIDIFGELNSTGQGYAREKGPGTSTGQDGRGGVYGGFGADGHNFGNSASNPYPNNVDPYGSIINPNQLGSGGEDHVIRQAGTKPTYAGGAGGGFIYLDISNRLQVNGTLSVNGGEGQNSQAGGGSGGSLVIDSNILDGSGSITADGGTTNAGGSGGRIAIYTHSGNYLTNISDPADFRSRVHAFGRNSSGAGTVYIDLDGNLGGDGYLYIHNNDVNGKSAGIPWEGVDHQFAKIFLKDYGHIRFMDIDSNVILIDENGLEGDVDTVGTEKFESEGLITISPTTFTIKNVDVNVLGDITSSNPSLGSDFTIGDSTNPAKMTLYAATPRRIRDIAPNQNIYTNFESIHATNNSILSLVGYDGSGASCTDIIYSDQTNCESAGETWMVDTNASQCSIDTYTNQDDCETANGTWLESKEDYGVSLKISGNFDIDDGAVVNSLGYAQKQGPGSNTGNVGRGGVYGGFGADGHNAGSSASNPYANTKNPYGSVYLPLDLGSGGETHTSIQAGTHPTYSGGAGGGAMYFDIAGTFNNNGLITVNGSNGSNNLGGGGAGGSILVKASELNGTGNFTANGGTSNAGGSGGRIAFYVNSGDFLTQNSNPSDFRTRVSATGKEGSGAGTIYIDADGVVEGSGSLYVHNNSVSGKSAGVPWAGVDHNFNKVVLKEDGNVRFMDIDSTVIIQDENGIEGDATNPMVEPEGVIILPTIFNINKFTLNLIGDIEGGDNLTIGDGTDPAGLKIYAYNAKRKLTVGPDNDIYNFNNITIKTNSSVELFSYDGDGTNNNGNSLEDYGPTINVTNDFILENGAVFTTDHNGYSGQTGPGATSGSDARGGSHGGFGADGRNVGSSANNPYKNSKAPYGSVKNPITLGSGGENHYQRQAGYYTNYSGGAGGGAITINIGGTLTVNGDISADGQEGAGPAGGGSGGSIHIDTGIINGTGRITADGKTNASGGRIAIYTNSGDFPLENINNLSAIGAKDANYYGAGGGTIFILDRSVHPVNGSLILDNIDGSEGYSDDLLAEDMVYHDVIIREGVKVRALGDKVTVTEGRGAVLNLSGDFTQEINTLIDATGRGFGRGEGPGAGEDGLGNSGGGGGAHGGTGGTGENDGGQAQDPLGGNFYGSQRLPTTLGSGGGAAGPGALGGLGGGAVAINAPNGHIQIDGEINVDGTNGLTASPGGGGGAGGSIWLISETCQVTGTLSGTGGDGGDDAFDGGAGGGGRLSLLFTDTECDAPAYDTPEERDAAVAQGISPGGGAGQVGTFPASISIPETPDTRDQFKTDNIAIPVGGYTQENAVILKASLFDPDTNISPTNTRRLRAEFEVVLRNEDFLEDPKDIRQSNVIQFDGNSFEIVEVNVTGLVKGEDYKWRVRAVNVDDNIFSDWVEFGANPSSAADFKVSITDSLTIDTNKTNVEIGEVITLTVDARDPGNSIDPTYRGTTTFNSTSSLVILPANYTYGVGDAGTHTFTDELVFLESGTFTVTAVDTLDGTLTATTVDITVNAPPATPTPTAGPTNNPNVTNIPNPTPTVNPCVENPLLTQCLVQVEIINVKVEVSDDNKRAKICWDTNTATIGNIDYGKAKQGVYTDSTELETEYKITNHCQTLTGLSKETSYIFRITATAPTSLFGTYEDVFATSGPVVEPPEEPVECIELEPSSYSFNAEGEVLVPYKTAGKATCKFTYGNNESTLEYESLSNELTKLHQGIIKLSNLDGETDIIYKIECSVALEKAKKGEEQKYTQCEANGLIPRIKFVDKLPDTGGKEGKTLSWWMGALPLTGGWLLSLYAIPWRKRTKKGQAWGIVFDKEQEEPLMFATVKLYEGAVIVAEKVTDRDGKYGFIVNKGKYSIVVEHPDYNTHKEDIVVEQEEERVGRDLALTLRERADKNIEETKEKSLKEKIRISIFKINAVIFVLGLIWSVVVVIVDPRFLSYIVAGIYAVQIIVLILMSLNKKKDWGMVYEVSTRTGLAGSFVRLFSVAEQRQLDVEMVDIEGRYGFQIAKGEYLLSADKPGYILSEKDIKGGSVEKSPVKTFVKADFTGDDNVSTDIPMKSS